MKGAGAAAWTSARKLPGGVWALGFVSLLMDISSELVHSLLPLFMATVLGASMAAIGVVEGVAQGTAAMTKVFSGVVSDRLRQRKRLAVIGYGLAALTKPVFPLATSMEWVLAARFVDRVGKGIRGAPRDALVADLVPPRLRGAAYGLRQALDSVGAFVGPMLAVLLMLGLSSDIVAALWVAVVPGLLAVLVLIVAVHEPRRPVRTAAGRRVRWLDAGRLPAAYWFVVAFGAVFSLARFSEAFLILRARDVGLEAGFVPGVMIVMNLVYALFAYPAGAMADRVSGRILLQVGLGVLVLADLVLAQATSPAPVFLGAAFWGLHMALTQGLLSKWVADTAHAAHRGTAFGIFELVKAGALLAASVLAGWLWSTFGASSTFLVGACLSGLAGLGVTLYHPEGGLGGT